MFACVVMAAVVALACVTYYVNSNSRYKVIGKVNPATGYWIEYTVSSRYRKTEPATKLSLRQGEAYTFTPNPPPKALQWIYTNILRRPAPTSNLGVPAGLETREVKQYVIPKSLTNGIKINPEGYPYLLYVRQFAADVVEQHMLVCGSPATWYAISFRGANPPKLRFYALLVTPKLQPDTFAFAAADDGSDPTGPASEMLKIRDSIKILKAH
jgi:hypothetical protein